MSLRDAVDALESLKRSVVKGAATETIFIGIEDIQVEIRAAREVGLRDRIEKLAEEWEANAVRAERAAREPLLSSEGSSREYAIAMSDRSAAAALRAALAADAAPPEPAAGETSEVCSACNGTGAEPEYREEECPRCKGRGAVYIGDDPDHCGQCGGTGSAVTPVYRRLVLPAPADAAHPEDGYRCPACGDGIVLATCDRCHETWIGERAAAALDARTADAAHGGERTCGVCGGPLNCEGSCQAKPIGHAPAAAPSPEAEEECECGHQRREHAGPKPGYGECFHGHASQRCACECFRRPGRSGGKP